MTKTIRVGRQKREQSSACVVGTFLPQLTQKRLLRARAVLFFFRPRRPKLANVSEGKDCPRAKLATRVKFKPLQHDGKAREGARSDGLHEAFGYSAPSRERSPHVACVSFDRRAWLQVVCWHMHKLEATTADDELQKGQGSCRGKLHLKLMDGHRHRHRHKAYPLRRRYVELTVNSTPGTQNLPYRKGGEHRPTSPFGG
jgi:hypothetical protein